MDFACEQYKNKEIAIITKRATPVLRIQKRLPGLEKSEFVAVYQKKSTVDYDGLMVGRPSVPVAFEAKSTEKKTRVVLQHGHEMDYHQYEHLIKWDRMGGWAFVLIRLAAFNETYRLEISDLKKYWVTERDPLIYYPGKAGAIIPIPELREKATLITQGQGVILDFLTGQRK
ncbi:MAG: Holliday junction resolvase RecU [Bacillota bacterium]